MDNRCHLDIETRSRCDLKKGGLYKYAEDPSTELLCFAYAFGDGPVRLWHPPYPVPTDLKQWIEDGKPIAAHNAAFERTVLNGVAGQKVGFPKLKIEQMICTAAKVAAMGLPRALEDAADVLGCTPKDKAGQNDMRYLCKPRKDGTFCEPHEEPERYTNLYKYNIADVVSEREIDDTVPDLIGSEQAVYELDQLMNDQGIEVDLESVDNLQSLIMVYKKHLEQVCKDLTGLAPSQTGKLADWIRAHGYPALTDLQADTVKAAAADPLCPPDTARVLRLFSTYNMKAVTKYDAIERAVCADGRLHGMFMYYGANTGRWSSLIVQLQNLFRPVIEDPEVAIDACRARDLDYVRMLYPGVDPMKVFASCVRSVLVPAAGRDLLFLDYSGIEARFNAWLWGEVWKISAFEQFDVGIGPDLYKVAFARAFRVAIDTISKTQRQIGKVMELALGYEGGVNAFVTMVDTYGINLVELTRTAKGSIPAEILEEAYSFWEFAQRRKMTYDLDCETFVVCDSLKRLWRRAHPHIMQGWADLKASAESAVRNEGQVYKCAGGKVAFKVNRLSEKHWWLCLRLPSGRSLKYYQPEWVADKVDKEGELVRGHVAYQGINTKTRRWGRVAAYGGKWCENICQAGSRDIMVEGKFNLIDQGYPIIGSVHDEIIMEPPEKFGSMEDATVAMCAANSVARGLPLAVEGHRAKRYRK